MVYSIATINVHNMVQKYYSEVLFCLNSFEHFLLSQNGHQYKITGGDLYKKHWRQIRNPASLGSMMSLNYLNIDVDSVFSREVECV